MPTVIELPTKRKTSRLDFDTVRHAATGRWPSILASLGIDVPDNPRKHGPCPYCGGRDRFRFDDQDGLGTWFCNQCDPQSGDGFALLARVRGLTIADAFALVADVLGYNWDKVTQLKPLPPRPYRPDARALAFRFTLAALDRRLRAQQVLDRLRSLDVSSLSDTLTDKLMNLATAAYDDASLAGIYEDVADHLNWKAYEVAQ